MLRGVTAAYSSTSSAAGRAAGTLGGSATRALGTTALSTLGTRSYSSSRSAGPGTEPKVFEKSSPVMAMMRGTKAVLGIRLDERPQGSPRADAIAHIKKILDANPSKDGKLRVGDGVMAAIASIKTLVGEVGARHVDTVFTRPELTALYLKPIDDQEAHEVLANAEREYWDREHAKNPSAGTKAATDVRVTDRVALQIALGKVMPRSFSNWMGSLQVEAGESEAPAPAASQSEKGSANLPDE